MIRDTGRFHLLKWGGGQVTVPQSMARELPWKNTDKLYFEYDEERRELRVSKLN